MKRMFKLLLILLTVFAVLTLKAHASYQVGWADTLDLGGTENGLGISVDNNGNVYMVGSSSGNSNVNWITVKYDSVGIAEWMSTINNSEQDIASDVTVDKNGNIYVVGTTITDYVRMGDYLIVEYDPSGNILWADTIDNNNGIDYAYGVVMDKYGNLYVTGASQIDSNYDYYTIKYDTLKNVVWADTFDVGSDARAYDIAIDSSENVYVTGWFYHISNNVWLTVKYDSSGNLVWADTLNYGNYGGIACGIAADKNDNVYVAGYYAIGSNYDWLTVKYDSSGNLIWADTIDYGGNDHAYGITSDRNGNIYVTGNGYNDTTGKYDFITVKYDTSGNIVWSDRITTGTGYDVTIDKIFNIYATGITGDDFFTVKYKVPFVDAGILSVLSSDTVSTDSSYTPQIKVINNSDEDTLSFDIVAYMDSSGISIYDDTQSVNALPAGDSVVVNFSPWMAPSDPMDMNLHFFILNSDMNPDNDTLSDTLHIMDLIPPVIDSAVAFDGANPVAGIDDDDYVILYFSEPTNQVTLDNANIDSVLSLSGGHSWLDGTGALVSSNWNTDGTELIINLSTNTSSPTIAIGDTITPDSATITDLYGNPCSSSAVLSGSFSPQGIKNKRISKKVMLNISTINGSVISFSCNVVREENYTITLYNIYGRVLWKTEEKESGYHTEKITGLPSGIYFLKLKQGKDIVNKKITVVK